MMSKTLPEKTPPEFRWLCRISLIGALLSLSAPALANPEDATDSAFGALLSMPDAQPPNGRWVIPENYVLSPNSEKELIAHLRKMKKDGANFNAIRHRGTLLAHAIRSGMDKTAIWLLQNGAKPRNVLFNSSDTAHDLVRRYQRSSLVKFLEKRYGFSAPKASRAITVVSTPSLPAISAAPGDRIQQGIALISKLLKTPYPDKAAQQEWKTFAAKLSPEEYVMLFKDGERLDELIRLVRDTEGGLENALSRLPPELVRQNAQRIADLIAELSFVSYSHGPKITYTAASRSWPALWKRIDQPLRYDQKHDLAGHIPPALWPALFASGYSRHEAAVTGCLLSALDAETFKALWPDFKRFFPDAREEAPGMVLSYYRLSRDDSCYYSSATDTAAKLLFLQAQGVTSSVVGLRKSRLEEAGNPGLLEAVALYRPQGKIVPRLIEIRPECSLELGDVWLDALIKAETNGFGDVLDKPVESVQTMEIPEQRTCGFMLSGASYGDYPEERDDFESGPIRERLPNCLDAPDDGVMWVSEAGKIKHPKFQQANDGSDFDFTMVRDSRTGKRYLIDGGRRGSTCAQRWGLPAAYEWQSTPDGPALLPSPDSALIERLLRSQCEESGDQAHNVNCHLSPTGADAQKASEENMAPLSALREGHRVSIDALIDALGAERKRDYQAAVFALDRVRYRTLLAKGIPGRWTAETIRLIGQSSLSLKEKRRRIALVFAEHPQLARALNKDRYGLPEALLGWLPAEDWGPIWRVIGQSPDMWYDAASSLRRKAEKAPVVDLNLLCAIDHAQGFLCGGGIEIE